MIKCYFKRVDITPGLLRTYTLLLMRFVWLKFASSNYSLLEPYHTSRAQRNCPENLIVIKSLFEYCGL